MTWKFKQIKPQKARGKYHEGLWSDPMWLAENKEDGERRIAQFCGNLVRFTGCRQSVGDGLFVEKTKQVPHLSNWPILGSTWRNLKTSLLDGTVLDGEMVPPPGIKIKGGGSKYVTSIMGSSPEEAIRKQKERGYLCYKVFDCLWLDGQDMRGLTLEDRRMYAQQAVTRWGNSYVSVSVERYSEAEKRRLYESAVEGVIFKHIDHVYGDEKLWVKRKKAWTADVFITGFTLGMGKYKFMVGAIEFGQYYVGAVRAVGRCSGMTDGLRSMLTRLPRKFTGAVIEITHNGREPSGKFRHPQFSRFRPDKSPKDCVYDQEET